MSNKMPVESKESEKILRAALASIKALGIDVLLYFEEENIEQDFVIGQNVRFYPASCGCQDFRDGHAIDCERIGVWKHPNYDEPVCDDHKKTIEMFHPHGWTKLRG